MIKNIRLKDFKADERVLAVGRRHWIIFLQDALGLLILFFLPFFAGPILSVFSGPNTVSFPNGFGLFFGSLWALVLWQRLFVKWTDYYYDIWIITNWKVIDIEQKGLWHRDVSTLMNLDKIQDASMDISGFLGTIFNYGTLQIQTAAANREFIFENVAHPRVIGITIKEAQEHRIKVEAERTRQNMQKAIQESYPSETPN